MNEVVSSFFSQEPMANDQRSSYGLLKQQWNWLVEQQGAPVLLARQGFVMLDFLSRCYTGNLHHRQVHKRFRLFLSVVVHLKDEECTALLAARNTMLHGGGNFISLSPKSYGRLHIETGNGDLITWNKSSVHLNVEELGKLIRCAEENYKTLLNEDLIVLKRFRKVYKMLGTVPITYK